MKTKKAESKRWQFCKLYHSPSHKSAPYRVTFYQGGKRHERSFALRKDAVAFLDEKDVALQNTGRGAAALSSDESSALTLWREARTGANLTEVIKDALARLAARSASVTLAHAIDALLDKRKAEGKAVRTVADLEWRLSKFKEHAGEDVPISEVGAAEIDAWLAGLSRTLSPQSVLNFRRVTHSLFTEAVRRGWTLKNPVTNATRPKVPHSDVTIYTPEEAAQLLQACPERLVAPVALGLFAGLRTAEIMHLDWNQIDMEGKSIRLVRTKTGRPRIVPIAKNLHAWLAPRAASSGPLCTIAERMFATELEAARTKAGIAGDKDNAMRHSYGTYRTASTQNVAQVSLEMGNTPKMVEDHYRELVNKKQASAFFAIVPKAQTPAAKGRGKKVAKTAGRARADHGGERGTAGDIRQQE